MNAPSRPILAVVNGHATTTSAQVAENFGKRHDHVLRAIRNLGCSPDFHLRNFGEVFHEAEGGQGAIVKYPAYTITRDGFVFLAMGFTGKEAAQWKEAYIEAFNAMEASLQAAPPGDAPEFSIPDTLFLKGMTGAERTAHQSVAMGANMLNSLAETYATYATRVACYTAALSLFNSATDILKQERARLCRALEQADGSAIGDSTQWPEWRVGMDYADVPRLNPAQPSHEARAAHQAFSQLRAVKGGAA